MRRKKLNPVALRRDMIVATAETGINQTEIARNFGVCTRTVSRILKSVKQDSPVVSEYRAQRAEVNAWNQIKRQEKQVEVLESITEGDIKKADLKMKMVMLNTLGLDKAREFEMERLETNQATENISIVMKHIIDIKKRDRQKGIDGDNPTEPIKT